MYRFRIRQFKTPCRKSFHFILILMMILVIGTSSITVAVKALAPTPIESVKEPPIYPSPALSNYANSSSLANWILTRLELTPTWRNGSSYIYYPSLLRDSINTSYSVNAFLSGGLWGYEMREFTYDALDIVAYYEVSGDLKDFIISIHDPLKLPANQTEKETAIYVADKLGIPILANSTDSIKVLNLKYGIDNATALIFFQSLNGLPLVGLNFTVFWFDQAGTLRQIQSYVYYDVIPARISSSDALSIGRNETLDIAGSSSIINESIMGLRLTPVFQNGSHSGNETYDPIKGFVLCYEYLAYVRNESANSPQGLLILIDSQDGSIRWVEKEGLSVEEHSLAFPFSAILVLLIPLLIVGAIISFVFVPVASFGFAAILSLLAIWMKGPRVLENFNRGRIIGYIAAKPGCSYSELREALGMANGPLSYHLAILEKVETIRSIKDGRSRHFYSTGIAIENPKATYLGLTEARILSEIERLGLSSNSEVAVSLGMSRQRVLYNIKRLAKRGLIEEWNSRWKVVSDKE